MTTVLFCAAHSGFNLGQVPLGGGAAICDRLTQEWRRTSDVQCRVLSPALLGSASPQNKDLVEYTELEYAAFCRRFEKALTEEILKHDPSKTVVLCNDVSEGPNFALLAQKGYRFYTIYHVDVVDYFATMYLRGLVRPERSAAFYRATARLGLGRLWPDVLKLVWPKQEDSVRLSRGLIVPSNRMKSVLLRTYPGLPDSQVHVLPWGSWEDPFAAQEVDQVVAQLRAKYPTPQGTPVLLMLSRISPEKGQHRLLEALRLWEGAADYPAQGIQVFISGEAAYMMGKKYESKLRTLADLLKRTRVHFVGYAAGPMKKALFKISDLYVFPSIHESYGLTLIEALRAGLPILTTASHGAREVFQPAFGEIVEERGSVPEALRAALARLIQDPQKLRAMGAQGAAWARTQDFSATASKLARLLASQ